VCFLMCLVVGKLLLGGKIVAMLALVPEFPKLKRQISQQLDQGSGPPFKLL
jgi:hypothetical protein